MKTEVRALMMVKEKQSVFANLVTAETNANVRFTLVRFVEFYYQHVPDDGLRPLRQAV